MADAADDVRTDKAALRRDVRTRRAARSAGERDAVAAALAARGAALCAGSSAVAAYASFPGEPGTTALRAALRDRGITVLLPVVRGAELDWVADDGSPLAVSGERGLPEPAGPVLGTGAAGLLAAGVSVVLVPALAVTTDGVRLGQGAGYYDRVLGALPPHPDGPLRVAVVHDDEVLAAGTVPAEPHDLHARLDTALTPGLGEADR